MNLTSLVVLLIAMAPLGGAPSAQQTQEEDELLRLLSTPITVASKSASTVRETPGVVSLITREEIQASGARSLIDILRMVPGFDFGEDVQGATGPSVRGLWGYEGKILLLWDGIEMNETLYGTVRIDDHFPVDQIKRIEIIRGPGSSVYGGFAELAVIQVTTLKADDLNAGGASYTYGRAKDATLQDSVEAIVGHEGAGYKFTLGAYGGNNIRSDGVYTDPSGTAFSLKDNQTMRPMFFNMGLDAGALQFRGIVDQYYADQRDNYAAALPDAERMRESSVNLNVKYAWQIGEDLTITPFALWRDQKPFWTADPVEGLAMYQVNRKRAGVGLSWTVTKDATLLAGVEGQGDSAEAVGLTPSPFPNGAESVSYTSKALYGQFEYHGPVNLTVGARWENQSQVGSAFVPRIGLTKVAGRWHMKLLYADAFRTPSIMNLNQLLVPDQQTQAEKTRTVELEGGVQLGPSILTLNLFNTKIKEPIVYSSTAQAVGYVNASNTGSRGLELEWKLRQPWGYLNANVSHYQAENEVSYWAVPGHDSQFLGAAPNKASLASGIKFCTYWTAGPSLLWLDKRWEYAFDPQTGGLALGARSADLEVNGNLTYARDHYTLSLALFDAGDRQIPFIQPYYGHGPLPGPGREVVFKARYGF